MAYPVKHFRETQTGAPVLSGTAGALLAVLDACLMDGFNPNTIDSLTEAAGVATATVTAGHGYAEGDILLIAGADQVEYNGEVKISNVTSTTFDFAVSGSPTTPATGTITSKVAPVGGWTRPFTGTNKAVYRNSTAGGLLGVYYRIDDSEGRDARIIGYESMTDVDTGLGPMPTEVQVSGGGYWRNSDSADTTARIWTLVADEGLLYWLPDRNNSGTSALFCMGQQHSWKLGDQYDGMLVAHDSVGDTLATPLQATSGGYEDGWVQRDHSQMGGAVAIECHSSSLAGSWTGYAGPDYPGVVDGGLYHAAASFSQVGGVPRGNILGLHHAIQHQPLEHGDIVTGALDDNRDLLVVSTGFYSSGWKTGRALFDITGPWR